MENQFNLPRIMIAAPSSGSGKTMITCGLLKLLAAQKQVMAYKCGPDYIDPMFHKAVLGIPSRNLDTFFTGRDTTRMLMGRSARGGHAELAVIEGVMGYFDGVGGISDQASSYDLAVQTETPVILVVNAKGMSLSVVALIKGFMVMECEKRISGVILNRTSKMIYDRLKPVIESELGIAALGYVPETKSVEMPGRHLGLMMPSELKYLQTQLADFAKLLEETIDIEKLLAIAETAKPISWRDQGHEAKTDRPAGMGAVECNGSVPVRIGIVKDEAFCFYYEDNLTLLQELGAELVPFSPIHDEKLPEHLQGLYMGGGYPELHAEGLSSNKSMMQSVKQAIEGGMPTIAECGAFMYLHKTMEGADGKVWPMVGMLDGHVVKKEKLVRFGYANLTAQTDTILGPVGTKLPAHEFHYWDTTIQGGCFLAKKPLMNREWLCMAEKKQLLAGFPHLYFYGNPLAAKSFVDCCKAYGMN